MRHIRFNEHPGEDRLEEYAFRRLREKEIEPLEEHLLICETCQDRLAAVDEYILSMKTAAAQMPQPQPKRWRLLLSPRLLAATAGLAALLIAGFLFRVPGSPAGTPAQVELVSFRGAEMARVPAKRPVDLSIDASDLPPSPAYRIEVVDEAGSQEWNGEALPAQARLAAHVS